MDKDSREGKASHELLCKNFNEIIEQCLQLLPRTLCRHKYNYQGVKCKHVHTDELSHALRQEVENVVIPEITLQCSLKHGLK